MEKIDLINITTKIFFINLLTYIAYEKIVYNKNKKLWYGFLAILASIFTTIIYIIMVRFIKPAATMAIICVINGIIISATQKEKLNYSICVTIISFTLVYIIYLIAVIVAGMILNGINSNNNGRSWISLVTIITFTLVIFYFIFRIKRLKKGMNFIKNIDNQILNQIIIIWSIINLWFDMLQRDNNQKTNEILLFGAILIFGELIIWIQSQITKHYKKDMKSHTIEVQKEEIEEHLKTIEEVKTENLKLATAVHKYNHRISALEKALRDIAENANNTEFAEEISVFLKETEDISKGFAKESEIITKTLPLTNITGIDNMFKLMQEEAINSGINFDLKINTSIHDLIDQIIPKDKFETLLGDHLKDAIIAINSSNKTYKSILVILGMVDNCYELSIYDTGIEFEIETLLKLGKERITTHKNTGGSGIGFMTTFETLKLTKASLIIEEYTPETTSYTKSVNIRFDGKNNYKIYSYRAEDMKNKNKDKKIIIKNIE